LRTPGKITASAAYIFGKKGLLSIDYINRAYQNLQFTDTNFATENNFFQNDLRNTHSVNVGSEWRFDRLSLRGGYRFEQNPDKFAIASENLKGYSLGAGYKFKGLQLDIAYTSNNNIDFYDFYPGFNVNDAELDINNKIITASVTINL
jgi:long-subunit fatty acid transport protein